MPRRPVRRTASAPAGQAAAPPSRLAEPVSVRVDHRRGGPSPRDRARARRRRLGRKWAAIVLFLLPAFALYCLLVVAPIFQAFHYSGYKWNGLSTPTDFVGLDNFKRAFHDDVFIGALKHNGIIVVLSLAVQLPFALGIAWILNQRLKGRALLRILFFAPFVLSEVVAAVVWSLILQPNGLADHTLDAAGMSALIHDWLADPSIVLYSVFVVISWKYFGFHMVLYLAGLQQIPKELEEAAAIDGANTRQIFRHITLPLLGPTIRISIFLSIIGAIQLFDLVWVMTGGGPVDASNTMAVYMINHGFKRFEFGYASAVAVIMLMISLLVAISYQRFVLRRDLDGALTTMGR
jgi:raffinose/stachyose/melibiose transport system permease protein